MRGQHHIAHLARGTFAAARTGIPLHALGDPRVCGGRSHRQADREQGGQVGEVVAHEQHLVQRQSVLLAQRQHRHALVLHPDLHVQAQVLAALFRRQAGARSDQRNMDAGLVELLEALSVEHVERLALVAGVVVVQAAVGQGAVDVETGQTDARGAFDQLGWKVLQRGIGHRHESVRTGSGG